MLTKIDWISFSVMLSEYVMVDERDTENALIQALNELNSNLMYWFELDGTWTRTKGRAPYSVAYSHPSGGIVAMYNPTLPHALIEISGRGCDMLTLSGGMMDVLNSVKNRVTRIDIASDILTDVRPIEFASMRSTGRFKSKSVIESESGETVYLGSRTSNRYVRVYRYNAPHERHMFLRIEYVVKAEDAKILARTLLAEDIRAISANLGEKFGWEHPAYLPDEVNPVEIQAYRPERHEGKTLYWLGETVAPLLARLHAEGVIDAEKWFQENVLSKIDNVQLNGYA